MTEIRYFELEELPVMVRRLGLGPVSDLGLLDSAVWRPRTALLGVEAYPSLEEKAAALLHSLARSHPWVTATNGSRGWRRWCSARSTVSPVRLAHEDAFELVMAVAEGAA